MDAIMSSLNIIAQPLSCKEIEYIAQQYRNKINVKKSYFPAEKIETILD